MKSILCPGIIAGLYLVCALSAGGQTATAAGSNSLALPTTVQGSPDKSTYQYDFISKGYVWSNRPLRKTAGKVCQTMRNHSFAETPYQINDDHDWNACLDTQIRSIGYMRWLVNSGFKANRRNRNNARAYLQKNYTMGPWGSYSFSELSQAVKATTGH